MACCPTSADDSYLVFITFRPHDEDDAASDRSDRNEPVFFLGMRGIEDLEIVSS